MVILMSAITLKDIPMPLHRELKQRAKAHGRSLNKEILHCLEAAVHSQPIDPEELLRNVRLIRENISGYLSEDDVKKFKTQGRP